MKLPLYGPYYSPIFLKHVLMDCDGFNIILALIYYHIYLLIFWNFIFRFLLSLLFYNSFLVFMSFFKQIIYFLYLFIRFSLLVHMFISIILVNFQPYQNV